MELHPVTVKEILSMSLLRQSLQAAEEQRQESIVMAILDFVS